MSSLQNPWPEDPGAQAPAARDRHWLVQLLSFAIVGTVGFLVDSGVLMGWLQLEPGHFYSGRILSYIVAATTTWALNATFTFGRGSGPLVRQWAHFLLLNLSGGAVNYCIYALMLAISTWCVRWPIAAVAMGSLGGLGANFFVSRKFVFARR